MTKNYELVLIVDSQLQEDGVEKTVQRYSDLIATQGGSVHRSDSWGVRKLAYEIKKHQQASYTFVQFQGEPAALSELNRIARLDDAVLRHLVVSIDELTVDPEPEEEAPAEVAAADDASDDDTDTDDDSKGSDE